MLVFLQHTAKCMVVHSHIFRSSRNLRDSAFGAKPRLLRCCGNHANTGIRMAEYNHPASKIGNTGLWATLSRSLHRLLLARVWSSIRHGVTTMLSSLALHSETGKEKVLGRKGVTFSLAISASYADLPRSN